MQVRARGRYSPVSPFKMRRVVALLKGRDYEEALGVLDHLSGGSARLVKKVLASAAANAEHNYDLSTDNMFVAQAFVDEGPTRRWYRARARGRFARIRRRSCHVTIVLDERGED